MRRVPSTVLPLVPAGLPPAGAPFAQGAAGLLLPPRTVGYRGN